MNIAGIKMLKAVALTVLTCTLLTTTASAGTETESKTLTTAWDNMIAEFFVKAHIPKDKQPKLQKLISKFKQDNKQLFAVNTKQEANFAKGEFPDKANMKKLKKLEKALEGEPIPNVLVYLLAKSKAGTLNGAQLELTVRWMALAAR